MAAGQAKTMPGPVAIVDASGRLRHNDVWAGNKQIATSFRTAKSRLLNCPNFRPYIANKSTARWFWKPFVPTPADIFLTPTEDEFGRQHAGKIIVEPNVKSIGHTNKAWIWERWQQLVDIRPGQFLQIGWGDVRRLRGVDFVPTHAFRLAAAVMKHSRAYVGPEGGLHHVAAAVGTPAVVLFGGFISPNITGYASHRNIFTGGKACGLRVDCPHCREAMAAITVDMVGQQLIEALNEARRRMELPRKRTTHDRLDGRQEQPGATERPLCVPGQKAAGNA
jgi:hypothetical protein